MTDDVLVLVLTALFMIPAGAIGIWIGLKLVNVSDLRQDQPRLKWITIGIWVSAIAATVAWLASGGRLSFMNACFGFALASIAVVVAFRTPKGS